MTQRIALPKINRLIVIVTGILTILGGSRYL